jgi:rare lipoprotein A
VQTHRATLCRALTGLLLAALALARGCETAWAGPGAERVTASWYGEAYRGRTMANGRPFNPDALTCASWHWPLGTRLRVSRVQGSRFKVQGSAVPSVLVLVTDRGPAKRLLRTRQLDLSRAVFARLAPPGDGLVTVDVCEQNSKTEAASAPAWPNGDAHGVEVCFRKEVLGTGGCRRGL